MSIVLVKRGHIRIWAYGVITLYKWNGKVQRKGTKNGTGHKDVVLEVERRMAMDQRKEFIHTTHHHH